jgi:hypothetical protein
MIHHSSDTGEKWGGGEGEWRQRREEDKEESRRDGWWTERIAEETGGEARKQKRQAG